MDESEPPDWLESLSLRNYNIVLPKDFSEYISEIKSLIKYADKVTREPSKENPHGQFYEMDLLERKLKKTKADISRFLISEESSSTFNFLRNSHSRKLNKLKNKIDGRLFWVRGKIPTLKFEVLKSASLNV